MNDTTATAETTTDNPPAAPVPKLLYTAVEAAAALGLSRSSVYVLLGSGELTSVRIGNSRRIPAGALVAYVDHLCEQAGRPT